MIIYIHGFGSSGFGGKATLLKEYFDEKILLPSLSYVPILAINTLEQLIEMLIRQNVKVNLIGSSLGGYYSIYLANKYNLKAVLINPAIKPFRTLEKIGMSTNYFDMSYFEVTQNHLEYLKELNTTNIKNEKNFMLLLQKGDELLDYKEAVNKLSNSNLYIEEDGSHSYDNVERHFEKIKKFLNN